jgi:hypothetical protein
MPTPREIIIMRMRGITSHHVRVDDDDDDDDDDYR